MNYFLTTIFACFILLNYFQVQAEPPKRIVSLAPSLTKMLYLVGAQDQIAGCTSYCIGAQKDWKNVVATAANINIEKVFLLKPDYVVATGLTKQSEIEALKKLGIKCKVYYIQKSFGDICSQFVDLAQLAGRKEQAQKIVLSQQQRLERLKKNKTINQKLKVFFQIGSKPLFTVIPGTFMNDYITLMGGENISSDMRRGTITRESVLLRNPDVIIIISMGVIGNEEKNIWKSFTNLSASRSGRIFIVDADKACSPTPVDFVDIVENLITIVH